MSDLTKKTEELRERNTRTGKEHITIVEEDGYRTVERKVTFVELYAYVFVQNLNKVRRKAKLSAPATEVMLEYLGLLGSRTTDVSQQQLAEDLGLTRQTVNKAVNELLRAGILIQPRERGHRQLNPNLFYMGSPSTLLGSDIMEHGMQVLPEADPVVVPSLSQKRISQRVRRYFPKKESE